MCMYSITQHLVCFSLREPIFRSTTEYYFSLTLVLVSLYVNPTQVCSTESFCRDHLIFVHVEIHTYKSLLLMIQVAVQVFLGLVRPTDLGH